MLWTTRAGLVMVATGTGCLGGVVEINKSTPILNDPSKFPLILLFLGIALLYAGTRWISFGSMLKRMAAAPPSAESKLQGSH